jgi:hypothetical protein
MRDTMRDLLSKLDAIISETALQSQDDLKAKRQALADLESDPVAGKDTEISAAIDQRKLDLEKEAKSKGFAESFEIGDEFGISFSEDHEIATTIVDILEDGIVIELDDAALEMLTNEGLQFLDGELEEGVAGPKKCWKGYRKTGTQSGAGKNAGKRVNDCEKIGEDAVEESGLQYYTGVKKHGKEYMTKAAQAARDGASQKELGALKDKYSKAYKEDHGPENPDADVNYGEYDREGDMAKDDLRTINDAAKELYSILDADENLPEWVQSKITKAVDYLDTARDYMKSNKYAEDAQTNEAEYQGRKVQLGKKMPGDVKKSKVYVKNPQGRVVKVNFGDKKMRIKKSNPARRKSFRARHNCANPGPRHKARYWSCRSW